MPPTTSTSSIVIPKRIITHAEILAGEQIEIVAAPGADKLALPSVVVVRAFGWVPYTLADGQGSIIIKTQYQEFQRLDAPGPFADFMQYGGVMVLPVPGQFQSDFLNYIRVGLQSNESNVINQAVSVLLNPTAGPFGGGASTNRLVVTGLYNVFDLSE